MYTDSRSIQEDSAIIQTHLATLNIPPKGKDSGHTRLFAENMRIYTAIVGKPACTRDYEGGRTRDKKEGK